MSPLRQSHLNFLILAMLIQTMTTLPPPAACQQQWGFGKSQANTQEGNFGTPQMIKTAPDLPQLPNYSGHCKFVRGSVQTNSEGYTLYSVRFVTREGSEEVRNWYRNALNMYQWNTTHSGIGGTVVNAEQKNGNNCSVRVLPVKEPVYRSTIDISYTIAPEKTARPDTP